MVADAERKEHPISTGLAEANVAMIGHAVGLGGRSRTEFVLETAVRATRDVLTENPLIRMSPASFADFMTVLSGPAAPVHEIVELVKRPAPREPGYAAKN